MGNGRHCLDERSQQRDTRYRRERPKKTTKAEETARLVKCLTDRHENSSPGHQNTCKQSQGGWCIRDVPGISTEEVNSFLQSPL